MGLTHYDGRFVSLLVERASAEMTFEAPGGTVSTPDGEATVEVPAGAVEPGSRLILLPTSAPGSVVVPGAENLGGLLEIGLLDPVSDWLQERLPAGLASAVVGTPSTKAACGRAGNHF